VIVLGLLYAVVDSGCRAGGDGRAGECSNTTNKTFSMVYQFIMQPLLVHRCLE